MRREAPRRRIAPTLHVMKEYYYHIILKTVAMLLLTTVRVSEHINRESKVKKHLLAEYVDSMEVAGLN